MFDRTATMVSTGLRRRELAGDRRAGSWARGEARRAQREFAVRHWVRLVAGVTIGLLPSLATIMVVVGSPAARAFLAGVACTVAVVLPSFWVFVASGSGPRLMGETAEQRTAADLRRQQDRGWRVVNRVVLGRGDIDHVLVGPGGLVVVETKWSAHDWGGRWGQVTVADSAARVRSKAMHLLRWAPIRPQRIGEVTSVLVLWGPGGPPRPFTHPTGTIVVSGPDFAGWCAAHDAQALSDSQVDGVWSALAAHIRQDGTALPASVASVLGRATGVVTTFCVGFLGSASVVRWTSSGQ
jgi:hypothetical protein